MWADTSSVLSALSFILSIAACLSAARAATRVRALQDQLMPLPLSRLESLETSRDELIESVTDLANRYKMIRVRNATTHTDPDRPKRDAGGMPDPYKNPDEWRRAMNSKLGLGKLGASQPKD